MNTVLLYLAGLFYWLDQVRVALRSIKKLVERHEDIRSINDLSTDAQTLFGFLALIVDIKYRNRYGHTFEDHNARGYSERVQFNKVLADQVSPVDNGLLGF